MRRSIIIPILPIFIFMFVNKPLFGQADNEAYQTEPLTDIEFNLYPNPTKGLLNFQLIKDSRVEIYNQLAQNVYNETLRKGSHSLYLDESPGIYFINILNETGTYYKKFIITE